MAERELIIKFRHSPFPRKPRYPSMHEACLGAWGLMLSPQLFYAFQVREIESWEPGRELRS